MPPVRTFIDSGLLIVAARGTHELSERAMQILDDPEREFVTSDFVRLEVLPKALYNNQTDEAEFYREFISSAQDTVQSAHALVRQAETDAEKAGLSAVDALHVAAARYSGCDELVTVERTTKPLFRVTGLTVTTIRENTKNP